MQDMYLKSSLGSLVLASFLFIRGQLSSVMSTHIVIGLEASTLVPRHLCHQKLIILQYLHMYTYQERLSAQKSTEILTRFANLILSTHADPVLTKNAVLY